MVQRGFLLAPEITEWQEQRSDGTMSAPFHMAQNRISFTELASSELPDHARTFGPFALEFEGAALRFLGAIPVFYLPRPGANPRGFEGMGGALAARMLEIQTLLRRLEDLAKFCAQTSTKTEPLSVTRNGIIVGVTRCSVGGAEDIVAYLTAGGVPARDLSAAFAALSGFFYPPEDLRYTEQLGYYRQREWRIIANMAHFGRVVSRRPTKAEVEWLLRFDPEFWGRVMIFPTGEYRRAAQCAFMAEVDDRHVLTYARRVVVPADAVADTQRKLASLPSSPVVVALEEVVAAAA